MTPYIPHFPLHLNTMAVFGMMLLLAIIGGELAKRLPYLPQISGYILMGFLVGPGGLNILNHSMLNISHLFVNISLSLILFDLGRQLDIAWLRDDMGLLLTSITEAFLTFALTFGILHFLLNLPYLLTALVATITIATSPAVTMMVANDVSAEGPVTRRTLILTSLNNLFALLLFNILFPFTQKTPAWPIAQIGYTLFGSLALSLLVFVLIKLIALLIGKRKENQFVLLIAAVVLTLGMAYTLDLSPMLALFMLGVAARNLDFRHSLMEIDFGWLARLFFILLFVTLGAHIHFSGLWKAPVVVIAILLARFLAKSSSMLLFFRKCRLTFRQAYALSLALLPMTSLAIDMSNTLINFNPDLGESLSAIMAATLAILNTLGPILTQHAFIITGEALTRSEQA